MTDPIKVRWGGRDVVLDDKQRFVLDDSNAVSCIQEPSGRWYATLESSNLDTTPESFLYHSPQEAVTALYSALRSIHGMGLDWRPIEGAPVDTPLLLSDGVDFARGVWCDHFVDFIDRDGCPIDGFEPTHYALVDLPEVE